MRLEEKNAIVTGASRGIGKAIVEKFARNGINIWACASKENEELEAYGKELEEHFHVWIKPIYFDLKNERQTKEQMCKIINEKKTIDILVNNAGIPFGGLMQMTSLEKLREVMEVNFVSQIGIIQSISRVMMRQKQGCIVNMGSVGGLEAREGYLAYGSSKAAFMWATRMISKELGPYNIRVNAVAPGLLQTDMGLYKPEGERKKILEANSMKRLGTPEEIAEIVYFLVSDEASFMTGTIVNADGGRL